MLNAARIKELVHDESSGLNIVPFFDSTDDKNGTASIDLRLGCWFIQLRTERCEHFDFGRSHGVAEDFIVSKAYVPFAKSYVLHPGRFVLASTLEWITLPMSIGGYVTGKSSLGRRGLVIETAPGVHPQFMGCLTLELANVGEIPLILQPGMPVCQLFLHSIDKMANATKANEARTSFKGERQPRLGKYSIDVITEQLRSNGLPKRPILGLDDTSRTQ